MKFNLGTFLTDLAENGPSIFAGIMAIKNEVPTQSKTQVASDSAKLAFGVTAALSHNDPTVVADATAASTILDAVIGTIAQHTGQTVQ